MKIGDKASNKTFVGDPVLIFIVSIGDQGSNKTLVGDRELTYYLAQYI